jgi:hypothetical protein
MADQSKATRTESFFRGCYFAEASGEKKESADSSSASRFAAIPGSKAKHNILYEPTFYDLQGA